MVSILVSVYNQDPSPFVQDLLNQLEEQDKAFEILIGNDASDSNFMPRYNSLEENQGVSFFHAENNLGRSKMRNTLASQAKYPYLLFIDGDAMLYSAGFISAYLEKAEPHRVICGGTAYHEEPPEKDEELLRWKYGINREARPAARREQNPYSSFSSFNFFLSTEVFEKIRFRESISRYGHEDTIFGIELEREGVSVKHIDNQLIHAGLDTAELFLEKTRDGLKNLVE